jgi:hypothetical protein
VPLSGGLDGRLILGELLRLGLRDRMVAATFGTPGTADFEIGRRVAAAAGVRHEAIDLTAVTVRYDELVATAAAGARWVRVLDAFYNRLIPRMFGTDALYWSGFMGDPLAGSHRPAAPSRTWQAARTAFARRNRVSKTVRLTPHGHDPEGALPAAPLTADGALCHDEQLDFAVRQQAGIAPLVLPAGYDVRTPFLMPEWIDFILAVPPAERDGERLYRRILLEEHPALFRLPTKTNYGASLAAPAWRVGAARIGWRAHSVVERFTARHGRWVHPRLNYIDFGPAIRRRPDLAGVVERACARLIDAAVVPWLDIARLRREHHAGRADHAFALFALVSLAANLDADTVGQGLA